MLCPLCGDRHCSDYFQDKHRCYYQCQQCHLVFVDPAQRLSPAQEKAEYDKHQNSPDDLGYRQFLSRFYQPLLRYLKPSAKGLDFGCGPGPTLSLMLEESGFRMSIYDVFYFNDRTLLQNSCDLKSSCAVKYPYDFICATEVVEHLFNPGEVIDQLWGLLPEGGVLGLMTKLVIDKQAFSQWHYKNDQTHVCFFSVATFEWLAHSLGAQLTIANKDVIFLQKKTSTSRG